MNENELLKAIREMLKDELEPINMRLENIEKDVSIIKQRVEGIFDQTHDLSEFRTSTANEIKILKERQDGIERKLNETNNSTNELFKSVADDIERLEDENLQNYKEISQLRATLKRKEVI